MLLNIKHYITDRILKQLTLFAMLCCFTIVGHSQVTNWQTKKISVSYSNVKLKHVLKDIEEKGGVRFSFSSKIIPVHELVNYQAKNKEVQQVLKEIFQAYRIRYQLIEKHLVLTISNNFEISEPQKTAEKTVEKNTISGFISDSATKELLIGATIYVKGTTNGSVTNAYGFYSISLLPGKHTINVSYLGYRVKSLQVNLSSNKSIDWTLQPIVSQLEEVVIESKSSQEILLEKQAALSNIDPLRVKQQAAALGETDVIKSLDNLPGISLHGDGSSFFYVRGGAKDQNLVLIDEATIYNPSHMLGLFTPVIPEAVKKTNIYKAHIPIQYGGRISSIVDIRTRDGNMHQFNGHASVGMLAGRLSLEGPLVKERSSYFISLRRSYFGVLFKAINPDIDEFYFSDFTAKVNTKIGDNDRLFFTFYNGIDKFNVFSNADSTGINWQNTLGTLRWNHVFNNHLFVNTTFYSSVFDYKLITSPANNYYWNSAISNTSIKSDFTYFANSNLKFRSGVQWGAYSFNPGNYNDPGISQNLQVSKVNSTEMVAFAGFYHNIGTKLFANYGIRFTNWANYGEAFSFKGNNPDSLEMYGKGEKYYGKWMSEPRLSLSYKFASLTALKGSYNRTVQNINLISNGIGPFNSLDIWIPSGPNIKPQKANIFNLGIIHQIRKQHIEIEFDAFYKRLYNQIGYDYHAAMVLNPLIEGSVLQGDGQAYGMEITLTKKTGKLSGQLSYTYSRSKLQIDGLNGNRTFYARQDRPHDLNMVLNYSKSDKWDWNLAFVYTSGLRFTTPTSFFYYKGYQVPVYTYQNNDRLPNYKRIDVSANYNFDNKGRIKQRLAFSVYNVLGFQNPIFVNFNKTYDEKTGSWKVPADHTNRQQLHPTKFFFYNVVPSVVYNIDF